MSGAGTGVQNTLKRLDSRFRGNDAEGLLQLAQHIVLRDEAVPGRRTRRFEDHSFLYVAMSISVIGCSRRGFVRRNWTDVAEHLG